MIFWLYCVKLIPRTVLGICVRPSDTLPESLLCVARVSLSKADKSTVRSISANSNPNYNLPDHSPQGEDSCLHSEFSVSLPAARS